MSDQVSKKVLNRMNGDPPPIINLHPANFGEGKVVANMAGLLKLHDLIEQALNALGEADVITMSSHVSESDSTGYKLNVVHVSDDEIKKERPHCHDSGVQMPSTAVPAGGAGGLTGAMPNILQAIPPEIMKRVNKALDAAYPPSIECDKQTETILETMAGKNKG